MLPRTAPGENAVRLPSLGEVPPAPRQPSRAARRLVFAYRGSQAVLLGIGAVFLVVGLGLSTVFCWGLPIDVGIALAPVKVEGTILSAETNRSVTFGGRRGVRNSGWHPTRVRYAFQSGGREWEGACDSISIAPGRQGPIAIEHASFAPGWNRLAGTTHAPLGWPGAFVLLFPALGAAVVAAAVRSNCREIRAFVHGRPILARVTYRGVDASVKLNGRSPYLVRWEFRTEAGGEVYEGSLTSMRLLDLEPYGNAEQVVVLHDPADPRINTLFVA